MKTSFRNQVAVCSLVLSIFHAPILAGANATPDYWKCTEREGGEWNYGRAPMVCAANAFGEDRVVTGSFAPVIFRDNVTRDQERRRYLEEAHAVLREAARVYLKRRKPSVSDTELQAWTLGVVATAAHESYWSHYRQTSNGRLKMMRGDFGHGHGLMQIDDRAHFPAVSRGIAWNLISHVTYAMDIYYAAWERAASQSCVKSASNYWEARIRSAWSAYNGGPARLCRWTNPNDRWAQNDKNFLSALRGRRWESLIANPNKQTSIPVVCLMENRENCAPGGGDPDPSRLVEGRYYRVGSRFCLAKNAMLFCVDEERDRSCLRAVGPVVSEDVITWTEAQASQVTRHQEDRHLLCARAAELIPVGSAARFKKNINLRVTPGGGILGVVPSGRTLLVRDFEVRGSNGDRYYRVRDGSREGYLFAGNKDDWRAWAEPAPSMSAVAQNLARVGERVRIENSVGINLRATPAGDLMLTIPRGTLLRVEEVAARGPQNKLYYKVQYNGRTGYIYTGSLLPEEGVLSWTRVVRP